MTDMLGLLDNGADILVLTILTICFVMGIWRGLAGSLFKIGAAIGGFIACRALFPIVSGMVRNTWIYDKVKEGVIENLGLETTITSYTQTQQANVINGLPLPDSFKLGMMENNNSVAYDLLKATNIVDYIGGYVANIIISVGTAAVLFLAVMIVIRILGYGTGLLNKMPVIRCFNRAGGGILGLCWGVIIVWLMFTVITLFLSAPWFYDKYEVIQQSIIAKLLYDNNIIVNLIINKLF